MNSPKIETQSNLPGRLTVLISGDVLTLLLFTWFGRSSHALSSLDIAAMLTTAAPFLISWFGLAALAGLFRIEVSQTWQKFVPRILLVWLIGGPLAGLLRALFLGRSIPDGIMPTFVLITMIVASLFLLVWRLGYSWWVNRRRSLTA